MADTPPYRPAARRYAERSRSRLTANEGRGGGQIEEDDPPRQLTARR
jgi:hypothetical protein